jgi:hypothetical protein
VAEFPPGKHKDLSSNPNTTKNNISQVIRKCVFQPCSSVVGPTPWSHNFESQYMSKLFIETQNIIWKERLKPRKQCTLQNHSAQNDLDVAYWLCLVAV